MAEAYVPGLQVSAGVVLRKVRRIALPGEVLVRLGQQVGPEDVVVRASLPGDVDVVAAAPELGVEPRELSRFLCTRVGAVVAAGEPLASVTGPFGWFRRTVTAPTAGTVEHISPLSGRITLRRPPRPIEVRAHVAGTVCELLPGEGAVVEARGALIQGVFGVGGERRGRLAVGPAPGCVWVTPETVVRADLARAVAAGAVGVVAPSTPEVELAAFFAGAYEAVLTGEEEVPLTLVLTEGFGRLTMATRARDLLYRLVGRGASLSGTTQLRAGVLRPEVFVATGRDTSSSAKPGSSSGLQVGAGVRLLREPGFGCVGRVVALPATPEVIATGARVRVVRVALADGQVLTVPRANVELAELGEG